MVNKVLNKSITYEGISLFGNFSLYNLNENIDFEASKKEVLNEFKRQYELKIKEILNKNGLKLISFDYYSPVYYNYETDSIDLIIQIVNEFKLIKFIKDNQEAIQERLNNNKSYDGYTSLTKSDIKEVIQEVKENKEVDILVIAEMLKSIKEDIFKKDNINYLLLENLIYDDDY